MMRDRDREWSTRQDRRNRFRPFEERSASGRFKSDDERWRSPEEQFQTPQGYVQTPEINYRGKGPRNYKPSDERIREKVCDLLCDNPYLDASDIEVSVKNSEVTLTGFVDDRHAKRLAEDIAEEVPGVHQIENSIRVNQG